MYIQADVGVGDADVWSLSRFLAELVNNSVLHLVRHELGVAELFREHYGIYGERLVVVEIFGPIHLLNLLIHIIGRLSLEMRDGFQNPDCRVQLEIGAIHQFLVSSKRHHTASYLHVVGTQLC